MIQEHAQGAANAAVDIGEMMLHHTADASVIDLEPLTTIHLPQWPDIHLGPVTLNLSPTKHLVFMVVAATLVFLTMWLLGRALERQRAGARAPRGLANLMEGFVLWIRQDLCMTNMDHASAVRFAPFVMTVFFFLLYGNLLGLLPWGATFTGNLAVTAAMAAVSFVVIEISGMVALGFGGYMRTIFPKVDGMGPGAGAVISVAMAPIEILGKLVKPFALCFRLFGNMTAGHFVILVLFGLIFLFAGLGFMPALAIGVASATLVTLIMVLEIIVAFVQAYVFAIITAVLIGMMQHEH